MTSSELPAHEGRAAAAFFAAPGQHITMLAELAAWESTTNQARAAGNLGSKPLIIVSAGTGSSDEWRDLQADLVTLSTNSRQLVVEQGTHQGLLLQQEAARMTSEAILQVIEAVRSGVQLASS
jgi:hypothetical protein